VTTVQVGDSSERGFPTMVMTTLISNNTWLSH